jgi:hypothetical protein
MANLKITELDALIGPADADLLETVDMEATPVNKKITWTTIKSFLKTYFDTLYDATGAASAVAGDLTSHEGDTANPHAVTKTQVSLGNVDNTSNATERAATATLTNKRITQRVVTATDDATAVIDVDVTDQYQLTAMATATTISTTGTPTAGQKLIIRLKDNATARALTWDAVFRAVGVTLPTTTVISKTVYIGCIYNLTDTKWDAVAVAQQA